MASPEPNRHKTKTHVPPPETDGPSGTRLSAHEIYENINASATEELERPARALLWSAIAAGLAIGFSLLAAAYLGRLVPERWRRAARRVAESRSGRALEGVTVASRCASGAAAPPAGGSAKWSRPPGSPLSPRSAPAARVSPPNDYSRDYARRGQNSEPQVPPGQPILGNGT